LRKQLSGFSGAVQTASGTVVLDTNVIIEAVSAELLNYIENRPPVEVLLCPKFRTRQLRARYSLLCVWHIAETGQRGISLHEEVERKLKKIVPPGSDEDATLLTEAIVHRVVGGLGRLEWIADDERSSRGNAADAWLVELAGKHNAPLLTNEGVTPTGIRDRKPSGKTIRVRAKKESVRVFAPVEFIDRQGIDHEALSERFISAARGRLLVTPAPGECPLHPQKAELLLGLYRFILFDELEPPVPAIRRPRIPWELDLSPRRHL